MSLRRPCFSFIAVGFLWFGAGVPVLTAGSFANDNGTEDRIRIVDQDDDRGRSTDAAINGNQFEVGLYTGALSVEDFGTEPLTGIEVSYHLSSRWLLQASYGQASVDRAAFETGTRRFLSSSDRDFEYVSLVGGYRLVGGRSFLGATRKFNSGIYVFAGPDRVSFAGDDEWGLTFGFSYRVVFSDWLTGNVDFREHFFERSFIGDTKDTLNTELRIGFNMLF